MSTAEARPTAPPRTAHTGDLVGTFSCSNLFFFIRFCKKQVLSVSAKAGFWGR